MPLIDFSEALFFLCPFRTEVELDLRFRITFSLFVATVFVSIAISSRQWAMVLCKGWDCVCLGEDVEPNGLVGAGRDSGATSLQREERWRSCLFFGNADSPGSWEVSIKCSWD